MTDALTITRVAELVIPRPATVRKMPGYYLVTGVGYGEHPDLKPTTRITIEKSTPERPFAGGWGVLVDDAPVATPCGLRSLRAARYEAARRGLEALGLYERPRP